MISQQVIDILLQRLPVQTLECADSHGPDNVADDYKDSEKVSSDAIGRKRVFFGSSVFFMCALILSARAVFGAGFLAVFMRNTFSVTG